MPAEESFFCRLFSWKVQIWFLSDAYPFSVRRISGSCPTHIRLSPAGPPPGREDWQLPETQRNCAFPALPSPGMKAGP